MNSSAWRDMDGQSLDWRDHKAMQAHRSDCFVGRKPSELEFLWIYKVLVSLELVLCYITCWSSEEGCVVYKPHPIISASHVEGCLIYVLKGCVSCKGTLAVFLD